MGVHRATGCERSSVGVGPRARQRNGYYRQLATACTATRARARAPTCVNATTCHLERGKEVSEQDWRRGSGNGERENERVAKWRSREAPVCRKECRELLVCLARCKRTEMRFQEEQPTPSHRYSAHRAKTLRSGKNAATTYVFRLRPRCFLSRPLAPSRPVSNCSPVVFGSRRCRLIAAARSAAVEIQDEGMLVDRAPLRRRGPIGVEGSTEASGLPSISRRR